MNGSIDILNLNFLKIKNFKYFLRFVWKIVYQIQQAVFVDRFFIAYDAVIVDKNSYTNERIIYTGSTDCRQCRSIHEFIFILQVFAMHCLSLNELLPFAKFKLKTGNYFVKMCKFILNICCFKKEREMFQVSSFRSIHYYDCFCFFFTTISLYNLLKSILKVDFFVSLR